MEDRTFIEGTIRALLKQRGFKKSRSTWRLAHPETILVLNLQKSQWGRSFYFNCGVYLRGLGEALAPPEFKCHIQTRVSSLVSDEIPWVEALDFESSMSRDSRSLIVVRSIEQFALPWLDARSTAAKARDALRSEGRAKGLVLHTARLYLGVDAA